MDRGDKDQSQSKGIEDDAMDRFIQERLLYRDTILKNIIKKYFEYLSNEGQDDKALKEDLLYDLSAYEFQIDKASRALQSQQSDRANLQQLHRNINKKIKITEEKIQELRAEYQTEEQIKDNKESYERVSQQINQYDDQESASKRIEQVTKTIEELKQIHSAKMRKINAKKKHLALILSTMRELTEEIN